jgi:peptide-methionine (R)-S-oxide reductase
MFCEQSLFFTPHSHHLCHTCFIKYRYSWRAKMTQHYSRRNFLTVATAASVGSLVPVRAQAMVKPKDVWIVTFSPAGIRTGRVQMPMVIKTDAQWRAQIPADSYEVTRNAGTERPFSGKLLNEHAAGIFQCICCSTALYDSRTKFESGTGWPSFYQPIAAENITKSSDDSLGMSRDAISCSRCDAHLGHVFTDGPKPTGLRYCMNSVSLRFAPRV